MNHQFLENYNSLRYSKSEKECTDPDDQILYKLTDVAAPDPIDTDGAWNLFMDNLQDSVKEPKGLSFSLHALLRTAAVLFIVSAVGIFSFLYVRSSETYETATVVNSSKERKLVELPDGTQVWLAKNATINYSKVFTSNRKVKLTGEAYFDVIENQGRFIVSTNSVNIEVLGTEFNVKNTGNESVHVLVTEGLVSFGNKDASKNIKVGQEALFDLKSSTITVGNGIDLNEISWKTGEFVFNEINLDKALEYFNKYYEQEVKLKTTALSKCKVSGSFKKMTLDEVLKELSLVLSLNIENDKNSFLLTGKGC